jgi:hypothetical protein
MCNDIKVGDILNPANRGYDNNFIYRVIAIYKDELWVEFYNPKYESRFTSTGIFNKDYFIKPCINICPNIYNDVAFCCKRCNYSCR